MFKQDNNNAIVLEKWRDFLCCKNNTLMFAYMRKTFERDSKNENLNLY